VIIKLIALKIEETPARCKLKIIKSVAGPSLLLERGGYRVQPTPGPPNKNNLISKFNKEGGIIQNLKLLRRGKIMSSFSSIRGRNQFPNLPIKTGIIIKKIISSAWEVIIELYRALSNKIPAWDNSIRTAPERLMPLSPDQPPKIK